MGTAVPLRCAAEMVRQLPDDGHRYGVAHGELLVTPAPRPLHRLVLERLSYLVTGHLMREPVGVVLRAPADLSWRADVLVQPDLVVVPTDEVRTLDWARMRHLLLAMEVVSPASARADRFTKRRLYQKVGIPLYWLVDADAQVVGAWTPGATFPVFERERLAWQSRSAQAPLALTWSELFLPIGSCGAKAAA